MKAMESVSYRIITSVDHAMYFKNKRQYVIITYSHIMLHIARYNSPYITCLTDNPQENSANTKISWKACTYSIMTHESIAKKKKKYRHDIYVFTLWMKMIFCRFSRTDVLPTPFFKVTINGNATIISTTDLSASFTFSPWNFIILKNIDHRHWNLEALCYVQQLKIQIFSIYINIKLINQWGEIKGKTK